MSEFPFALIDAHVVVGGHEEALAIADELNAVFSRHLLPGILKVDEITAETKGVVASLVNGYDLNVEEARVFAASLAVKALADDAATAAEQEAAPAPA